MLENVTIDLTSNQTTDLTSDKTSDLISNLTSDLTSDQISPLSFFIIETRFRLPSYPFKPAMNRGTLKLIQFRREKLAACFVSLSDQLCN